jgi:tyrosine-protein kinase
MIWQRDMEEQKFWHCLVWGDNPVICMCHLCLAMSAYWFTAEKHAVSPAATEKSEWLHPNIDRRVAMDYLNQYGLSEGLFLVRKSGRTKGCHALSLVVGNQVNHYEIQVKDSGWYYIDDGPLLPSLEHVIDYYMHRADGLPIQLKTPFGPSQAARLKKPMRKSPSGQLSSSPPALAEDDADDYSKLNEWDGERPPAPIPKPWPTNQVRPGGGGGRRPSPAPAASNPALIDRAAVVCESELGQGEFGSVMKGYWTNRDGQRVCTHVSYLVVQLQ